MFPGPSSLPVSCVGTAMLYTAEASGDVQVKDHRLLLYLKRPFLRHKHIPLSTWKQAPLPHCGLLPSEVCSSGTLEAQDLNYRIVIPQDRQPYHPPWSQPANYLVCLVTRTLNQNHQSSITCQFITSKRK